MRAAFEMFKNFDTQDAADNRKFAVTKLPIPVLTIEGEKAMGGALDHDLASGSEKPPGELLRRRRAR